MTLVELLATMAIVSMLMVASMSVVTGVTRVGRLSQRQDELQLLQAGVRQLLEPDLIHARRYRNMIDGFEIETLSALAPQSLQRKHWPAVVTYQTRQIDDQPWLLRTQVVGVLPPVRQLVGGGISNVDLQDALLPDVLDYDLWKPAPEAWLVTIHFSDADRQPKRFVLQAE